MTQEEKFVKNKIFHREEGNTVEFKEIKGEKPVNKIVDHAEEYITGFLNASLEGDIYFGIEDSGKILGVLLNRSDKDKILNFIPNKLRNTKPPVIQSCYSIDFYNVCDEEEKEIENLYIVQIHTLKLEFEPTSFYKTVGGSIYFKKGSSCIKLNDEEIAQEYKNRHLKYLRKDLERLNQELIKEHDNIFILQRKAEIARLMGDVEMMNETFEKLIAINPNNSKTRIKYAHARTTIGDLEGSLSIIDQAINLDEDNPEILKEKGTILFVSHRLNEALQLYQEALKINPNDYIILTKIGIIFRELNKYTESIVFFNYALSKAPNYRAAKYEKQKTYSKMFKIV